MDNLIIGLELDFSLADNSGIGICFFFVACYYALDYFDFIRFKI